MPVFIIMIRTVLGDIKKEELGTTLAHEHFIVDLNRIRKDGYSFIQDVDEVVPEIHKAMDQGIQAAFEVTTNDMGRDRLENCLLYRFLSRILPS